MAGGFLAATIALAAADIPTRYVGAFPSTQLATNITGVFTGGDGLRFVPTEPTRMLDTRTGLGDWAPYHGTGQTIDVRVATGAQAVSGTITLVAPLRPGWLKAYPCCASTHRPVDALLSLGVGLGDIDRIDAMVSEVAAANLRYAVPRTPSEARFSLPYCLAAALADGTLSMASFSEAAIARPALRPLMDRTSMRVDPELRGDAPVVGSFERGTLAVHLRDGSVRTVSRTVPHGHSNDPLTDAELDAKFRDCSRGVLAQETTEQALAALQRFDALDRVSMLTSLLRAEATSGRRETPVPAAG